MEHSSNRILIRYQIHIIFQFTMLRQDNRFLFICIINTGVGFACYFKAMEMTSARETSLVFFFKPIIAPLFALAILGEEIPLSMMIGIVFILLGSLSSILPALLNIRKKEQVDSVDS